MYKKILIVLLLLGLTYYVLNFDLLKDFEKLKTFILNFGTFGWFIFILLFSMAALVSIHGSILAIAGGIIYGPIIGGILSVVGGTLGATLAFLTSRYLLRDVLEKKFSDNPIYQKIDEGMKKNGTNFLIITRLVIIFPYNIQNFVYGLTNIELKKYMLVTFITIIPGTFLYTYLASELVNSGFSLSSEVIIKVLVAGVLLSALAILPKKYFEIKGKI